ncbi:MAG: flagellar export chaperone FlgN [Chthonomonadales bacterium]|nr:flagellar export chaperone FlgN [Chthonomonadales bacterium]
MSHRGLVGALVRALQQELDAAERVHAAVTAMTGALVANDGARVGGLCATLDATASAAPALERRRVTAAVALAVEVDLPPTATLAAVAARLGRGDERRLLALREKILAAHADIMAGNERNRALLATAIEYTQVSLEAIAGVIARASAYGGGRAASEPMSLCLDHRA